MNFMHLDGDKINLDASKYAVEKRMCELSFVEYIKQAWHVIEPGQEYKHNWHIDAIADHLTAIAASGTRIWYNLPVQNLVGVMESTDMTRRGTHPTAGLHQGGLVVVGNKVFVANGASRLVVALRESSGKIIRGYRTGATPSAMCVAAGRLWVTNFNERSVSGIAL